MKMKFNVKYLLVALGFAFLPLKISAQANVVDKYPIIPFEYKAAYVDQISEYVSGVVKSMSGQYFGQVTPAGEIYGYGSFFADSDGEVYGLYRNGNLAFGIKKGTQIAKVGTNDHYIAYDLSTGNPIYIMKYNEKINVTKEIKDKNKFLVLLYPNGDKYVGETSNNERHGYGLYFYTNGDFYYGEYKNNKQCGYGALFRQKNSNIIIQCWE